LNCQDFADEVLLHAAGALEPEEVEPLLDHLASGCPRCAGRLTEAKSLLGLLAVTLPPAKPSEESRRQLLARLSGPNMRMTLPAAPAPPAPLPMRRPAPAIPWWMQVVIPSAIAATIAAIVTIFFAVRMEASQTAERQQVAGDTQRTLGQLTSLLYAQQAQIGTMSKAQNAMQMVQWQTDRNLKTIALAGTSQQPTVARGRVFWDTDRAIWCFYAQGMRPAPAGKTYELWFVSGDGKVALPAGSFDPSADGSATIETSVPPKIAPVLAIAAVTDEPAGVNIVTPSGQFQLEGTLGQ
jgi:hypothetical protein